MSYSIRYDMCCRICGSQEVETVFKLVPTPLEDLFISKSEINTEQPVYPLEVALCLKCNYVYLPDVVNMGKIYSGYLYESQGSGFTPLLLLKCL